jgi:hypothetical protein
MYSNGSISRLCAAAALTICLGSIGGRAEPAPDATAQPTANNLDTLCAQIACRKGGYDAVVRVDSERYTTVPVSRSPYVVDDNSILIFPGETIAIQFTIENDQLTHPKMVERFAPKLPAYIPGPSSP